MQCEEKEEKWREERREGEKRRGKVCVCGVCAVRVQWQSREKRCVRKAKRQGKKCVCACKVCKKAKVRGEEKECPQSRSRSLSLPGINPNPGMNNKMKCIPNA